jgi:mono/diheme cytochrome c family protein
MRKAMFGIVTAAATAAVFIASPRPVAAAASDEAATRGAYVFAAAGCQGCHTDEKNKGAPLAGGRALVTPFGTFYTPNITPDPKHGVGGWSEADFFKAMRDGTGPGDKPLFPAFPFTSYARMTDGDIKDLFAYLKTQAPADKANRDHELGAPFGWRFLLPGWRFMFHIIDKPVADNPNKSAEWNRGRYIVDALGHCGECHTERGPLGAMDMARYLAGNPRGPEGDGVPPLTRRAKKFGAWSISDVETYLEMGMDPDGDFAGSAMAEVIRNTTSKLTKADRKAIAVYLKDLPAGR